MPSRPAPPSSPVKVRYARAHAIPWRSPASAAAPRPAHNPSPSARAPRRSARHGRGSCTNDPKILSQGMRGSIFINHRWCFDGPHREVSIYRRLRKQSAFMPWRGLEWGDAMLPDPTLLSLLTFTAVPAGRGASQMARPRVPHAPGLLALVLVPPTRTGDAPQTQRPSPRAV